MNKSIIIPKQIVTADNRNSIFREHAVEIIDGIISKIIPIKELELNYYDGNLIQHRNYTLIPGFVQTHIHLCQTLFRGLADDMELLDWLQQKIFPMENSHTKDSLRLSVQLGINELISGGTTTIVDMGTLRHQEVVFEELHKSNMRAFAGKCMIDQNELYPQFCESTEENLKSSYDYAKSFHNSNNGKIKYAFAPRFVLSCTENLWRETKEMIKDFEDSLLHTHASENKGEIETVRRLTGKENIEYFESIGMLNNHTILAHCIHLNNDEVKMLKKNDVRVSHCPSSNLKLGSGIANIPKYLKEGISVSIGADGAPCNNSLSIFKEMNLAALLQKPLHGSTIMDAKTVFRLATIEGAKAIHMENEIGSIEVGKKADLVLLDLDSPIHSLGDDDESIYSDIVYSSCSDSVKEVMIEGELIVKNGECLLYDRQKTLSDAKNELKKLLGRI